MKIKDLEKHFVHTNERPTTLPPTYLKTKKTPLSEVYMLKLYYEADFSFKVLENMIDKDPYIQRFEIKRFDVFDTPCER